MLRILAKKLASGTKFIACEEVLNTNPHSYIEKHYGEVLSLPMITDTTSALVTHADVISLKTKMFGDVVGVLMPRYYMPKRKSPILQLRIGILILPLLVSKVPRLTVNDFTPLLCHKGTRFYDNKIFCKFIPLSYAPSSGTHSLVINPPIKGLMYHNFYYTSEGIESKPTAPFSTPTHIDIRYNNKKVLESFKIIHRAPREYDLLAQSRLLVSRILKFNMVSRGFEFTTTGRNAEWLGRILNGLDEYSKTRK